MKSKKRFIFIIISIVVLLMTFVSIGISFAYMYTAGTSSNGANITAGNIISTVTYSNNTVTFTAMNDTAGMAQTTYGTVQISKTHNYSTFVYLNIGYPSTLPSGITTSSLIPLEYVRAAIYSVSGSTLTLVAGPMTLADLPMYSVDTSNFLADKYTMYTDKFNAGSVSKKYAVKVWLDEYTPNTYSNKNVYLNLYVDEFTANKSTYVNLTSKVFVNGTATANIPINFSYRAANSAVSTTGTVTIPTIPTGVHVITLTYNNVKYSTTLNILTGSTTGVTALSSASRTGGHIQDVAYQTYTTPKRIIDYNSLTITTNDSLSTSVNNPLAYILTVLDALDTKTYTVNFRINTTTGALEITSS